MYLLCLLQCRSVLKQFADSLDKHADIIANVFCKLAAGLRQTYAKQIKLMHVQTNKNSLLALSRGICHGWYQHWGAKVRSTVIHCKSQMLILLGPPSFCAPGHSLYSRLRLTPSDPQKLLAAASRARPTKICHLVSSSYSYTIYTQVHILTPYTCEFE